MHGPYSSNGLAPISEMGCSTRLPRSALAQQKLFICPLCLPRVDGLIARRRAHIEGIWNRSSQHIKANPLWVFAHFVLITHTQTHRDTWHILMKICVRIWRSFWFRCWRLMKRQARYILNRRGGLGSIFRQHPLSHSTLIGFYRVRVLFLAKSGMVRMNLNDNGWLWVGKSIMMRSDIEHMEEDLHFAWDSKLTKSPNTLYLGSQL